VTNLFFEKPVLNSPYDDPRRHWELDAAGQPTQKIVRARRRAEFITPIPKPRKRSGAGDQAGRARTALCSMRIGARRNRMLSCAGPGRFRLG
jgi:hypothetical protein